MIVLFVDNLFFYSGGQLVSCKGSLAALRLYGFLWYCYDDVLSHNKYDDDDDILATAWLLCIPTGCHSVTQRVESNLGGSGREGVWWGWASYFDTMQLLCNFRQLCPTRSTGIADTSARCFHSALCGFLFYA